MHTVLALDFGVKKMGIAVGNGLTQTAQPLTILPMQNGQPNWADLFHLIHEWQANTVIVGLPLNMDGTESHLSKRATKFAKRLNHKLKEQKTPKDIYLVDERLSSNEARNNHPNSKKNTQIDDVAACYILDLWFSSDGLTALP